MKNKLSFHIRASLACMLMLVLLAGCGEVPAQTPTPEATATPEPVLITRDECYDMVLGYMTENFESLPLYSYLSDTAAIFADYSGEGNEIIRYTTHPEVSLQTSTTSDDVFYWVDESGDADEQTAAHELIDMRFADFQAMDADERNFTLLDYSIKEQTLYSFEGLAEYQADNFFKRVIDKTADEASAVLDEEMQSAINGSQESSMLLALGENMWILDPLVTIKYEGRVSFYMFDELEDIGYIGEDGFAREPQQGSSGMFIHILIREGNVWRMQRLAALKDMLDR